MVETGAFLIMTSNFNSTLKIYVEIKKKYDINHTEPKKLNKTT